MNWLNYHHLFYFWTVISEGSFTKAAIKLRIAQSAVSSQVAQLENFFGKKLILRSTSKKIALTEEGQLVFDQADEIFRLGRELKSSVKDGVLHSILRIGTIGSLSKNMQIRLLRPVIENHDYELNIEIADPTILLHRLKSYHLDAILCDVPYSHSEDEPLFQTEIAKEPILIVGKYLINKSEIFSELLSKHGIYLPARSNPVTAELESFLKTKHKSVKIRGYIDDIALLRLLAIETNSFVAIPKIGAERDLKTRALFVACEFKALYEKCYLIMRQKGNRKQTLLKLLDQQ